VTDLLDKPTKETPPARRLQYGRMVAGVGLVGAGLLWFLDRIDALTVRPAYLWAGALIVVGIALMVGSFERERPGLVVLGVFVTIGALLAALGAPDGFRGGFGDQRIRVSNAADRPRPAGSESSQDRIEGRDRSGGVGALVSVNWSIVFPSMSTARTSTSSPRKSKITAWLISLRKATYE